MRRHLTNIEVPYDLWQHGPIYVARVTGGPAKLIGRAFAGHTRYLVSATIAEAARALGHPDARPKATDILPPL